MLERTDTFYRLARALRNWQLIAFMLVISNVVLAGGLARIAAATRTVPYLVELSADGKSAYAGPIEATPEMPEDRLIVAQLRFFVWNLRAVVDDKVAQQELISRAYALADAPVRRQLDDYFSDPENDPRAIAPKATRSAERIRVLKLPGTHRTFEVRWTERYRTRNAFAIVRERTFQGLLTVDHVDQLPREALALNPLGILITELTWTETTEE